MRKDEKAFESELGNLSYNIGTLSYNMRNFEMYVIDNINEELENKNHVIAYFSMIKEYTENLDKKGEELLSAYDALYKQVISIVSMEYANDAKDMVRVFLSNNTIILKTLNDVRACGLSVHDEVVLRSDNTIIPKMDRRTGKEVPFLTFVEEKAYV
ncbi:MAG: hypothetical protein R3Y11_00535 [Pseudomonadota bacterium]